MSKYNVSVQTSEKFSQLIADLNKEGLRAACKFNGVSYSKLNNDGMRDALLAHVAKVTPVAVVKAAPVAITKAQDVEQQVAAAEIVPPVTERETTMGVVVKPKSLKIEKGREKSNGVSRPSTGSICRGIWDQLDAARAKTKATPTFELLRDLMKQYGWSRNTAMTQFQRWKQFNGVMPRTSEATEEVEADEVKTETTDGDDTDSDEE